MITAEVSQQVYSTVTGRTGNWSWVTTMYFAAVPAEGAYILWNGADEHTDLTDRVRRVYYYARPPGAGTGSDVAIDLEPLKTDSPDILNEAFKLHQEWTQLGGPWTGQEEEK